MNNTNDSKNDIPSPASKLSHGQQTVGSGDWIGSSLEMSPPYDQQMKKIRFNRVMASLDKLDAELKRSDGSV
jgi:hypothetical protein